MVIFGYEGCEDVFHPNLCFNAAVIGPEKWWSSLSSPTKKYREWLDAENALDG